MIIKVKWVGGGGGGAGQESLIFAEEEKIQCVLRIFRMALCYQTEKKNEW